MKKIAAIMSALTLVNSLATAGYAYEINEQSTNDTATVYTQTNENTSEYSISEDVSTLTAVYELDTEYTVSSDTVTILNPEASTYSAFGTGEPASPSSDNPHINIARAKEIALLSGRTDGKYEGWAIANMSKSLGGDGYKDALYTSWTCTCGFVQNGNVGHICAHILSAGPSSAGGYGVWWDTAGDYAYIRDHGYTGVANRIYGPELFSGRSVVAPNVTSPFTSTTWGQVGYSAGESNMTVDPVAVPYITYDGERYYYYDGDGMIGPGNKTNGWVNLYLGGSDVYEVRFETGNDKNEVFAKTVVGDGNTVAAFTDPTKSGYSFYGWFIDDARTIKYDFDMIITNDMTVYAKWGALAIDVDLTGFNSEGLETIKVPSEGFIVQTDIHLEYDENDRLFAADSNGVMELLEPAQIEDMIFDRWQVQYDENDNVLVVPIYKHIFTTTLVDSDNVEEGLIEIIEGNKITLYDNDGNIVKEETILSNDVVFVLDDPEYIPGYLFTDWEITQTSAGTIITPIYEPSSPITVYDENLNVLVDYDVVIGKNIIIRDEFGETIVIEVTENMEDIYLDPPQTDENYRFLGWVTEEVNGHLIITANYVNKSLVEIYNEAGEFMLEMMLVYGDYFIIHDAYGNVIDMVEYTVGMDRFDLEEPAVIPGYHHSGWEVHEIDGHVYIKPVYCPDGENDFVYDGGNSYFPKQGNTTIYDSNGTNLGNFTTTNGTTVTVYDKYGNTHTTVDITGQNVNDTITVPPIGGGYTYVPTTDKDGNVSLKPTWTGYPDGSGPVDVGSSNGSNASGGTNTGGHNNGSVADSCPECNLGNSNSDNSNSNGPNSNSDTDYANPDWDDECAECNFGTGPNNDYNNPNWDNDCVECDFGTGNGTGPNFDGNPDWDDDCAECNFGTGTGTGPDFSGNPEWDDNCVECDIPDGFVGVFGPNNELLDVLKPNDNDVYVTDPDGNIIGPLTLEDGKLVMPDYDDTIIEGWYATVDEDGNTVYKPILTAPTMSEADLENIAPSKDEEAEDADLSGLLEEIDPTDTDESKEPAISTQVPQTNDNNTLLVWFGMLIISILAFVVVNRKKIV